MTKKTKTTKTTKKNRNVNEASYVNTKRRELAQSVRRLRDSAEEVLDAVDPQHAQEIDIDDKVMGDIRLGIFENLDLLISTLETPE